LRRIALFAIASLEDRWQRNTFSNLSPELKFTLAFHRQTWLCTLAQEMLSAKRTQFTADIAARSSKDCGFTSRATSAERDTVTFISESTILPTRCLQKRLPRSDHIHALDSMSLAGQPVDPVSNRVRVKEEPWLAPSLVFRLGISPLRLPRGRVA